MKCIILIAFLVIIDLAYPIGKCKISNSTEIEGKALIIFYDEGTEIKILKDYKKHNRRFKYTPGTPIPNPWKINNNRTLDVDGIFTLTDTSRVIFCGLDGVVDISLPFHYKEVSLNSLTNDSTIRLTISNRDYLLEPGKIYIDSLVSKRKVGKRIIQDTKIIRIENYGLIYKKNVFDSNGIHKREMEEKRMNDSIDSSHEKEELEKMSK